MNGKATELPFAFDIRFTPDEAAMMWQIVSGLAATHPRTMSVLPSSVEDSALLVVMSEDGFYRLVSGMRYQTPIDKLAARMLVWAVGSRWADKITIDHQAAAAAEEILSNE